MKAVVIDASAVAAAIFLEPHAPAAQRLLGSDSPLYAPDLIYAEVANVIWKRFRRGDIDQRNAAGFLHDATQLPIRLVPSEQLLAPALALAMQTDRTVYDCLYLALAVQMNSVMVSDDRRLVNALSSGPLKRHVAWLGQTR